MPHDHEEYHRALDRASWFERPLNFQDLAQLKKKIKDAEQKLVDNSGDREEAIKEIEDAEHEITHKAENFRGGKLDPATRTTLQNLADWLGGDGPPEMPESERPERPTAPIPHEEDPYDPGHIKLSRIFNWLLSITTKHLRRINEELAKVKQGEPDQGLIAARNAYWKFREELDGFRKAIANFDVREMTTSEGFIVSATVVVKYLNPKHSSSTVRIG